MEPVRVPDKSFGQFYTGDAYIVLIVSHTFVTVFLTYPLNLMFLQCKYVKTVFFCYSQDGKTGQGDVKAMLYRCSDGMQIVRRILHLVFYEVTDT